MNKLSQFQAYVYSSGLLPITFIINRNIYSHKYSLAHKEAQKSNNVNQEKADSQPLFISGRTASGFVYLVLHICLLPPSNPEVVVVVGGIAQASSA